LTHGAVGFVLLTLAIVVGVQSLVDAHFTIMTMLKIFISAYTAKATVWTVIRLFIVCHPKIANTTVIFSESNTTTNTVVPIHTTNDSSMNV
jgi:hypothetical protein